MKTVVIGLGVQGNKRKKYAHNDFLASVDPENKNADFRDISCVPLDSYDAAVVCVPDKVKTTIIEYLIKNRKHVLVEKPLWAECDTKLAELEKLANQNNVVCYTGYNHRFEPHFIKMRKLIQSGDLGKIYHVRLFYGNGTARLVRNSDWRDKGSGVLHDLGSHLLDTVKFWFEKHVSEFKVVSSKSHENAAPDHVVIYSDKSDFHVECEVTLLSWRNHFSCDVFAERGSAHINSLCKWGPSEFIWRERVFPSGRPIESKITTVQDDPTWRSEYQHFSELCKIKKLTNLSHDIWLNRTLRELGDDAVLKANG